MKLKALDFYFDVSAFIAFIAFVAFVAFISVAIIVNIYI